MVAVLLLLAALVWAWRTDRADECQALRRALDVEEARTDSYARLAEMWNREARTQRANAAAAYRAIETQAERITALQTALRKHELTLIADLPTLKLPSGDVASLN
jgi:hypothetical protein